MKVLGLAAAAALTIWSLATPAAANCLLNGKCPVDLCYSKVVTCHALDQCHIAGTCNPSTGFCTNPIKPNSNGTACDDGNACTQTDICQGGTCTGTNPVVCTAQDRCHLAGTCNPSTGQCSNPIKTVDVSGCIDGNPCPLPTLKITNTTIAEGGSINITFTSNLPVLAGVDWGDNSEVDWGTRTFFTHTYFVEKNYIITTNYADAPTCVGTEKISVTVINAAASLSLSVFPAVAPYVPYEALLYVSCSDAGFSDNELVTIDWGDGTLNTTWGVLAPAAVNCKQFFFHTYTQIGTYTISASVMDSGYAFSEVKTTNITIVRPRRNMLRGEVDDPIYDNSKAAESLP